MPFSPHKNNAEIDPDTRFLNSWNPLLIEAFLVPAAAFWGRSTEAPAIEAAARQFKIAEALRGRIVARREP
jgi:hypothetical protein